MFNYIVVVTIQKRKHNVVYTAIGIENFVSLHDFYVTFVVMDILQVLQYFQ